jgi:hypothetical protein
VEHDGLADLGLYFCDRGTRSNATREIRDIGRVVALGLFNHDGIAHTTSRLQTGLLEDAVQGARSEIIARFARDSDAAGFDGMLELAVATARSDKIPTIGLQQAANFADFHMDRISGRTRTSPHGGPSLPGYAQRWSSAACASARSGLAHVGSNDGLARGDEWEGRGVADGLNGKINVELRPVQVIRRGTLNVRQLLDRGLLEPWELSKRYGEFLAAQE